jgi:hypothetical protein
MTDMIRKQIYIRRRQELVLRRLARARGVSEAEIIRQAIDDQLSGHFPSIPTDSLSLDSVVRFALARRKHGRTAKPYRWNRDELYQEREAS